MLWFFIFAFLLQIYKTKSNKIRYLFKISATPVVLIFIATNGSVAVIPACCAAVAGGHLGPGADGCAIQTDGDFRKAGIRGRYGADYLRGLDAVFADGGHLLCDRGARRLAGGEVLPVAVRAPGGLYTVSVPAGADDCGGAVFGRGAVSLPQDCPDESGGDAEK